MKTTQTTTAQKDMENLVRELEFTFKKTEGVLLADKAILSSDDSYRAFKEIIGDEIEIFKNFGEHY